MDPNKLDDPIWEYMLATKLQAYLPAVRRWWSEYEKIDNFTTGSRPIEYSDIDCPFGLHVRMTNTPVRSPIKHIQAFPYVPTSCLDLVGIAGGVNKMVERICSKEFILEEFTIIEKHNLPSAYQKGQIICFVPTDRLKKADGMGKYVYLTVLELCSLAQGKLLDTVSKKCMQYLDKLSN